jgi:DDE superfamily endonuclease/winged helix-turn-helix protein
LHQSPRQFGCEATRWRLQDVRRAIAWLQGYSEAGIYKLLKRLGFSHKQARPFIRSPDPDYRQKWLAILLAFEEAVNHPETVVFLLLDELTYYRQPHKAPAYYRQGRSQPKAPLAHRANTRTRVVAVLNGLTGKVTYRQRWKVGRDELKSFFGEVRSVYPQAKKIYLAQDNWPTHKLADVRQAMAAYGLTPLFFPTYASWLNPIEKLWRWLRQKVLHLHPYAQDLETLRTLVIQFLDQFSHGSEPLLKYVGLLSD